MFQNFVFYKSKTFRSEKTVKHSHNETMRKKGNKDFDVDMLLFILKLRWPTFLSLWFEKS